MIYKNKKRIKLYSSLKDENLIISKDFDVNEKFKYVDMTSNYMSYYELHNYIIKVSDSKNEEYDIEAYRIHNTNDVFVKGIVGLNIRERITWNEVFEGDCPIVV